MSDLKPCPLCQAKASDNKNGIASCPDGECLGRHGMPCDLWQALPRPSESVLALRELADRVQCGHRACRELVRAVKRLTEPKGE